MSAVAIAQKPARKFPPPCWTREEALVLIEAYRERWHALHRAFLRTPDWDAVAEKVTVSCPEVTPAKTSAQCRHKMEKLRQRHRAEKQRASTFSGDRFFSSWFYFEAMEAMENGSNTEPGNDNNNNNPVDPEIQIQIPIPNSTISSHPGLNPGRGIRFKPSAVQNLVTLATSSIMKSTPNFGSRVPDRYSPYTNNRSNQEDDEDGYLVETPVEETLIRPSIGGGVRIKPSITPQQDSGRSGLRPRKFSKVVHEDEVDNNGEMWIKVPRNTKLFSGNYGNNSNSNGNDLNEGKKKGMKKNKGGLSEVVSSIKLLGDGFMKMEKMKIDMAWEVEKMRMETEMKRNQLILESQKQIVDAFVKGLIESRKSATMAQL